jgi:hypothetical protein
MSREAMAMMQHQMKPPPSAYSDHLLYLPSLQQGGMPSRLIANNLIAAYQEVAMKSIQQLQTLPR